MLPIALSFPVQERLPFQIIIQGETDAFQGMSIESRFSEIKACFSTFYKIDDYDRVETVTNPEEKSVQILFELKTEA